MSRSSDLGYISDDEIAGACGRVRNCGQVEGDKCVFLMVTFDSLDDTGLCADG